MPKKALPIRIHRKYIPIYLAWLMVVLMVAVAELSGQKEIIFPEIAALVIGGWVAPEQPWEVSRLKQVILMALSSFIGIIITGFCPWLLFGQVMLAFIIVSILILLFRCTFLPVLSACILPILMGVSTPIYALSVTIMMGMIALLQHGLEGLHHRQPRIHTPCCYQWRWESLRILMLSLTLAVVSGICLHFGATFVIAPPLIVGMASMATPHTPLRRHFVLIFLLVIACSCVGAWCRLLFGVLLGLPLTIVAAIIITIVLIIIIKTQLHFPPAGALALLPLIIPVHALYSYPLQVAIGFGLLSIAGLWIARYGELKFFKKGKIPS